MNCPLVVLTYPGHMLLTWLTIKSYFRHNENCPVIVVLDNLGSNVWSTYIEDCIRLYSPLSDSISFILASDIGPAAEFKKNNWVRQQIIKLHLDLVIKNKFWLFTDGDIEYCHLVPENKIPFTLVTEGTETQALQNSYVKTALNITDVGIRLMPKGQQICVSNPPWRWMSTSILKQLRSHIEQIQDQSVTQFHLKHQHLLVSEWELLANFEQNVLNRPLDLILYPTWPIESTPTITSYYCKTCYCTDSGLGREWFTHKGIAVSDSLWQTISSI